ncbi:MAG: tetraacyldisaccharide 4'-kinase [Acidobacteria bacterium]|nr:MAG: tetraacyldisaccharide 4'-kinase [Acidobacteriota bacterium]
MERHFLMRLILLPLSILYTAVTCLRNWLFDRGFIRVQKLDQPVISIGNLAMGGTGKTPITSECARILSDMGYKVGILSRGYGRKNKTRSLEITPHTHWQDAGDEPLMLARQNPKARVFVGPSRFQAARACTDNQIDVYLIDDGFQHRYLHRDLNMVCIDATQPLPPYRLALPFREGLHSLRRADLVIITRCPQPESASELISKIQRVVPNMPIIFSHFASGNIQPVFEGDRVDRKDVIAYSGIERPQKFFRALDRKGYHVRFSLALPDHGAPNKKQWDLLYEQSQTNRTPLIVTTQKDAVKVERKPDSGIILSFVPLITCWRKPEEIRAFFENTLN